MNNGKIWYTLLEISQLLELIDADSFKIRAYKAAADRVASMVEPIDNLVRTGALRNLEGIGAATAQVIQDLVQTGNSPLLQELRKQVPGELVAMLQLQGVGPKTVKRLYKELGITTLAELEEACKNRKIRNLSGFGPKTEEKILHALQSYASAPSAYPIGTIFPLAEAIRDWISVQPGIIECVISGDLRRMTERVSKIELVVAAIDTERAIQLLSKASWWSSVNTTTERWLSGQIERGAHTIPLEIRVTAPSFFGSVLHLTTGSSAHIHRLLEESHAFNLQWSIDGFVNQKGQGFADEVSLYHAFDLPYIEPELREDRGEIEAAKEGVLPHLIELSDILGDLHMHSVWSDGSHTIEELAQAAILRGFQYIAITDHSRSLSIAGGLTPERLQQQRAEIDRVAVKYPEIHIFKGTEMDILADGRLDFDEATRSRLDVVVASIHSAFRQSTERLTSRATQALQAPYVHFLGHPTGRLLSRREGYPIDLEKVLDAAVQSGAAIEINSSINRLDLDEHWARKAKDRGIPIVINTDAHHLDEWSALRYGIGIARRAWLTRADVLNAWSLERVQAFLKNKLPG